MTFESQFSQSIAEVTFYHVLKSEMHNYLHMYCRKKQMKHCISNDVINVLDSA